MADRDDPAFLARYPFLAAAKEHVQSSGYALGDLLQDRAFEQARRRAAARVEGALSRDGISAGGPTQPDLELFSYPLARALVAAVDDAYLTSRYAVAESKLAHERLGDEDDSVVWRVARDLGLPLETDPDAFARVPFVNFLRSAPGRDPKWKLINQSLSRGFVALTREQVLRLAEESLKERLLAEMDQLERPGKTFTSAFDADLARIKAEVASHRARFAPETAGPIRVEAFPPCMVSIWNGIKGHVNIPHMGRFAIVSFLHALGMTAEDILRFFSSVPDFDVSKSRYQIEHITGQIGATQYTPPSCSTMQTYGICPLEARDDICLYSIHHPLSYYRKKVRMLPPPAPVKAPEVTGAAPAGL